MDKNYLEIAFLKDEVVISEDQSKIKAWDLLCKGRLISVIFTVEDEWHVIQYKRIN